MIPKSPKKGAIGMAWWMWGVGSAWAGISIWPDVPRMINVNKEEEGDERDCAHDPW